MGPCQLNTVAEREGLATGLVTYHTTLGYDGISDTSPKRGKRLLVQRSFSSPSGI